MSEQESQGLEHQFSLKPFAPNYSLDPEELRSIEQRMVSDARTIAYDSIVVGWVDPKHEYSNFLRTIEAQKFPEVNEVDVYYENHQTYLALIDTRGCGRIVHAATIMELDESLTDNSQSGLLGRTGYYTIDSLIELGNFTSEEFRTYYEERGVDLSSCISVETNFKIREDVEPYLNLGTADLTYLTLFNMLIDRDIPKERTVLFASVNEQQSKSLIRNGIKFEYLMGRRDFHTEEADLGKISVPIAIEFMSGYDLIAPLGFKLPEVTFDVPTIS